MDECDGTQDSWASGRTASVVRYESATAKWLLEGVPGLAGSRRLAADCRLGGEQVSKHARSACPSPSPVSYQVGGVLDRRGPMVASCGWRAWKNSEDIRQEGRCVQCPQQMPPAHGTDTDVLSLLWFQMVPGPRTAR